MKPIAAALGAIFIVAGTGAANASWQAMLIPNVNPLLIATEGEDWALVVQCTSPDDVSIAYIEKKGTASTAETASLAVQADADQNYTFEAKRYEHNDEFIGYEGPWTDYSTIAVEAMGAAFNTVSLHLEYAGGEKVTRTIAAAGAAKAVGDLFGACGIAH